MRFLRRFSVPFVGVFAITAISSLFAVAQTTVVVPIEILVRYDGVGEPNVPVLCTQTGEVKLTSTVAVTSNGRTVAKGTAVFTNGITNRSKYKAYFCGAWHNCDDDCDGPNTAVNHFHCELPSLFRLGFVKNISGCLNPVPATNISVCITDTSNNYLGYYSSQHAYISQTTNANGLVFLSAPKNTTFRIWCDVSGGNNWTYIGECTPLTSELSYTFSLSTILKSPLEGDYIDGSSHNVFEWYPRVKAASYRFWIWHDSFGWGYENTTNTYMAFDWLPSGTLMWAVESYDSTGNYLDTTADTDFYVY
jgi:hypothetical protein